ncbi:ABC transporter permease [Streptomyces sp. DSM 44915]|uniref:ABC transporter permease n=1 Tax=Streptomyces chisholmiae TaxID=3075540 RepID=A0ABU2JLY4_9ACTN|nr:ABC transporter permease [Streptomyces sp. DSM 44915]MDT0265990.1 ABC transporter permease [Streptomyces sp. DSM 44915]
MLTHLMTKAGQAVLTIFLASVVVFLGVRALPGDPAVTLAGDNPDPQVVAALRAELGLDQPLATQYVRYVEGLLHGDFGESVSSGQPVATMLGQALPVTLQLTLLTVLCGSLIGVATGVVAACRRGRWPEWAANGFSLLGLSVPNFWLAILAVSYVASVLTFLPTSGYVSPTQDPWAALTHLIVPALILSTSFAAIVMRQTRASMLEAFGTEYVLAARAKGMRETRVVLHHALRNSLVVVLTIIGLQLGALLSGAAVIEQIFGLPGIGRLAVRSVFSRDYPVVQAVVLISAVAYVLINLLVDALYTVIDPRVRVGGQP